jgi:hypothetical protein
MNRQVSLRPFFACPRLFRLIMTVHSDQKSLLRLVDFPFFLENVNFYFQSSVSDVSLR